MALEEETPEQEEPGDPGRRLRTGIATAVGTELRRARERAGLTRATLVERLPSTIHIQTFASYERGIRQCTLGRFIEICHTMGTSPAGLLARAMQRAQIDLPMTGIDIDLQAVISDKRPELLPLRRWARNATGERVNNTRTIHLDWTAIQALATAFGIAQPTLVAHLIEFIP